MPIEQELESIRVAAYKRIGSVIPDVALENVEIDMDYGREGIGPEYVELYLRFADVVGVGKILAMNFVEAFDGPPMSTPEELAQKAMDDWCDNGGCVEDLT